MNQNAKEVLQNASPLFKLLNKKHITWAVGGSLLLALNGFDVEINDVDILIDVDCHDQLLETIEKYPRKIVPKQGVYLTTYFYSIVVNGIKVDLMLDFKVKTTQGIYDFPFNSKNIDRIIQFQAMDIPLSSVEEWKRAYNAMNRIDKIELLKKRKSE